MIYFLKKIVRMFFIALWLLFGVCAWSWCLLLESKKSRQEVYEVTKTAVKEIWRM